MVAGETGKLGIIRRARDAGTAGIARYSDVRDDIRGYLCDAARTRRTLDAVRVRFKARSEDPALGNWARENARLSMDVLDSLVRMENQIAGGRFVPAPQRQVPLIRAGVTVSIYLDVMMVREREGIDEIGGVIFRMTKADEETDAAAAKRRDMGAYAATLAFMHVQEHYSGKRVPHHQLCASFDIQCEEVHYAPRTYVARAKALEDACKFIAAMWDIA